MIGEHPPLPIDLTALPGEEFYHQGIVDLKARIISIPALLIAIGFPRLQLLGLVNGMEDYLPSDPDLQLYQVLSEANPANAYSQYNAWIRRLVSFERAAEQRMSRAKKERGPSRL
jgi:hypothetical protein